MKKGERFKLESAWWEKNKAKTLKSDLGLRATLKKYEAAVGALKSEPSEARYKLALNWPERSDRRPRPSPASAWRP